MKLKAALLVAIVAVTLLLTATPAGALDDVDCGDGGTHENMPLSLLDDNGGDPHQLDHNGDGLGCETQVDLIGGDDVVPLVIGIVSICGAVAALAIGYLLH